MPNVTPSTARNAPRPPELIRRLADTARAHPLREKLLLAPSYRVGAEWVDWAARAAAGGLGNNGGIVNMRLVTPKRLLLDFVEDGLRRRKLRIPPHEETIALVGRLFAGLSPQANVASGAASATGAGYFTRLPASFPLVETLARALDELESAGLPNFNASARHFASREKFDELAQFLREYRRERGKSGSGGAACATRAALLDCALEGLRRRAAAVTGNSGVPLLLVPESVQENADADVLALVEAWPEDKLVLLAEDAEETTTALCRAADSTANEARQVFRTIFANRIPLDTVEIITTDARTYVPALCDAALEVFDCPAEDLPLTFHSGLPALHSRPARLVAAWLDWLKNSLPPAGLADMLRDGLLGDGSGKHGWRKRAPNITAEDLAARLLQLPVYGAPEEYRLALGRKHGSTSADESESENPEARKATELREAEAWLARTLMEILPLANGGHALALTDAPAVLRAAAALLRAADHTASKLDAYANTALAAALDAWLPHCDWPGFQPVQWLENTVANLQIMGMGPQPGAAHVTDIASGGFSGRAHTFVLGLDDVRFPGGARQDPVLLDKERLRLSRVLPVSARARDRREAAMRRLLARLRGNDSGTVTLSYARHDAEADREQYPSTLFTRFAENAPRSGNETVLRPAAAGEITTPRDALLHTVLAHPKNALTPDDFAPWFPNLAQGWAARAARQSGGFTVYDGNVPEAGEDYRRAPWAISPTDMETLATNPAEYFYKRVLKITPPDRFEPAPGKWLEGNERGSIVHDLFQDFVGELIESEDAVTPASFDRHRKHLIEMLDRALARFRRRKPIRDRLAAARERGEMTEACAIFLLSEIKRNEAARPIRLEAALGGSKADTPPWEQMDAVNLPLPSGAVLPLKGRIDRIDRLHDHGGLTIWDYKTGRSDKFSATDPFQQGRHLQPLLYSLMLHHTLNTHGRPEPIRSFSYFFPMPRDEGKTLTYEWSRLVPAGIEIVEHLRELLTNGAFPVSPLLKDRAYSDYEALFPAAAGTEMNDSPLLAPWKKLRAKQ